MARNKKRLQRQHGRSGYDLLPSVAFHCETRPLRTLRCECEASEGRPGPAPTGALQQCPDCAKLVTFVRQGAIPANLPCQRCQKEAAVGEATVFAEVQCMLCARLVCASTGDARGGDGEGAGSDGDDEQSDGPARDGEQEEPAAEGARGAAAAAPAGRVQLQLPSLTTLSRLRRDQMATLLEACGERAVFGSRDTACNGCAC